MEASAMAGLRVLELADQRGSLCGRLLADMGADVIKVEPPGGDPARRIGPFLDDRPHPDRSLFFWFYNLNKRAITLDYTRSAGAEILLRLADCADIVIESLKPGRLAELGLGWEQLHRRNPALILCSIAPFGQTGPYRDYEADDTVAAAMGGLVYICGYRQEKPVRAWGLQAYHCANYYAAIAALGALFARARDGLGQWVDVSIQESTMAAIEHLAGNFFGPRIIPERYGTMHWARGFRVGKCRDGYVMHCLAADWTSLIEWVKADGKAQDLDDPKWGHRPYQREHVEHVFDVLDEWIKDYPAGELLRRAQTLRLPYGVVQWPDKLLEDEQLAARGYFVEVEHPELGRTFRYPGAPYLFGGTPWRLYRRPPLLGEHTVAVLGGELGIGTEELAVLSGEEVI